MLYPIAERFVAVQGEGAHTGVLMYFVRLAGCNVGQYEGGSSFGDSRWSTDDFKLFKDKRHSICTTATGEHFLCDTDYHSTEKMTPAAICYDHEGVEWICITGGEPFLHDLKPLVMRAISRGEVHIETSGTLPIYEQFPLGEYTPWITCSPKKGFLEKNYHFPSEWKLLVGPNFDVAAAKNFFRRNDPRPVYLQPIQGVSEPSMEATQRVLELVRQNPAWRFSAQLHKYIGER